MKWIDVFNRGFRTGANARAASGIAPGRIGRRPRPAPRFADEKKRFYACGYRAGYEMGASDDEIAAERNPGAAGKVRGLSEEVAKLFVNS
jgi:hypothetical protein